MKTATVNVWLALAVCVIALATAGRGSSQGPIDSIPGTSLRVIEAATPEFKKRGLNLDQYVVSLFEQLSSYAVVFTHQKQPPGQRGSPPDAIGFEVEAARKTSRFFAQTMSAERLRADLRAERAA